MGGLMKAQASTTSSHTIVRLLSSFRLAIVLILSISVMLIVGTLLPSTAPGHAPGEPVGSLRTIISFFRFDDIFHSPLFLFLGVLLFMNIVVCTGKQAHRLIGATVGSRKGNGATSFTVANHMPVILRSLIHAGIAIIMVGCAVGGYAGFESYVEVREGTSVSIASFLPDTKRVDNNLEIWCDNFTIEYYDSGMPKEYRSDLSFRRDKEILHRGSLMVNHPISLNGIRYYQSSYRADAVAVVTVTHKGHDHSFRAGSGEIIRLSPDTSLYVSAIKANFMNFGPAAKIEFTSPSSKGSLWLFYHIDEVLKSVPDFLSRAPQFNPSKFDGYEFSLTDLKPLYSTGIMVTYDPGIPIVAVGSVLLLVGLFFPCFVPRPPSVSR
jgi:cytochrome c biogenesis protein